MPGIWIVVIWSASLGFWMGLCSLTERSLKDPNAKPDGYTHDFVAWPLYKRHKTRSLDRSERLLMFLSGIGLGIVAGLMHVGIRAAG